MTDTIDISPEAVERFIAEMYCDSPLKLQLRRRFVEKLAAERDAAAASMTLLRAETAAAYERAAEMCIAPEAAHIAWDMQKGYFPKRSARHEFIAAMIRALATLDQSSALAAVIAAAEARGMRRAADIVIPLTPDISDDMLHGRRDVRNAILAAIPQGEK